MNNRSEKFQLMNEYGINKIPFLFIIDFFEENIEVKSLNEILESDILFNINDKKNYQNQETNSSKYIELKSFPISFINYQKQFNQVFEAIKRGDTYLLNLTCESKIECNIPLKQIFLLAKAKYKLYYKDKFVFFSPETFVKIIDNKIFTYPMKGTIDASENNAKDLIINNKKEIAEHATTVDLLRNDLSLVSTNVEVKKFRYVEEIETQNKKLLQISSEISGDLMKEYHFKFGDLFSKLLPAGSICGAPKIKTTELIKKVETHKRDFYTGVFGIFDGENLDSGVMIRFIEKRQNKLYYKSGGGITHLSKVEEEYNELLNKIYVPIY